VNPKPTNQVGPNNHLENRFLLPLASQPREIDIILHNMFENPMNICIPIRMVRLAAVQKKHRTTRHKDKEHKTQLEQRVL
jgi:hypothetical protein